MVIEDLGIILQAAKATRHRPGLGLAIRARAVTSSNRQDKGYHFKATRARAEISKISELGP